VLHHEPLEGLGGEPSEVKELLLGALDERIVSLIDDGRYVHFRLY